MVMNVHGYIDACQGFPSYPNVHHQVGLFGSPLSLPFSSASRATYAFQVYLEDGCWKASTSCGTGGVLSGDGISLVGLSTSSSEEL